MSPIRTLIASLTPKLEGPVVIRGWVYRLRELAKTTFIVVRDCSGEVQCVADPKILSNLALNPDDPVEIQGMVRPDARASKGFEIDVAAVVPLNRGTHPLPFYSFQNMDEVGLETVLDNRPLSLRNPAIGEMFRVQATLLRGFREFLRRNYFTEIITSKIVSAGTEGGANLFEIKYFDRSAYLAQSPQCYKEYGVSGLERVFETGHIYRAEPHATSRHVTEIYSLDLELGFIDGPEEVIQLERELLNFMFDLVNREHGDTLMRQRGSLLPSMMEVPTWEFSECMERLYEAHGRRDLTDDLDGEAERQLCALAAKETGVPAVFVLGFPLSGRPFYTAHRDKNLEKPWHERTSEGFDLLFGGLEITSGGKRLHSRQAIEASLLERGMRVEGFEEHLRMYEHGMPPHGGLAIGLERLTARIFDRNNIREAIMYPRDRYRVLP